VRKSVAALLPNVVRNLLPKLLWENRAFDCARMGAWIKRSQERKSASSRIGNRVINGRNITVAATARY
jgi:hypothetical protein